MAGGWVGKSAIDPLPHRRAAQNRSGIDLGHLLYFGIMQALQGHVRILTLVLVEPALGIQSGHQ
jgi:hypothetical protein